LGKEQNQNAKRKRVISYSLLPGSRVIRGGGDFRRREKKGRRESEKEGRKGGRDGGQLQNFAENVSNTRPFLTTHPPSTLHEKGGGSTGK